MENRLYCFHWQFDGYNTNSVLTIAMVDFVAIEGERLIHGTVKHYCAKHSVQLPKHTKSLQDA